MALTPQTISRLKAQLLTSGLSQKNQPLYQVINLLIDSLSDLASTSATASGGGSSGGSITGATYLTSGVETASLPNSRQVIAGAGIQFNDSPSGRRVISTAFPYFFGGDEGEGNDGPPGPQGPQGAPGPVGPTGANAISMFYAYDAEDGEDGLPGLMGPQGFSGAQGPIGQPGIPGTDGIDGEDSESTFIMNAYLYPPLLVGVVSGVVTEEVQDAPFEGSPFNLSLNKNLELRVQTDIALRDSIEALIMELRETREFLMLMQGVR